MKRLGKFTGNIYPGNYDFSTCPECCTVLSDEVAQDETRMESLRSKNFIDCTLCTADGPQCPASHKNNKEEN